MRSGLGYIASWAALVSGATAVTLITVSFETPLPFLAGVAAAFSLRKGGYPQARLRSRSRAAAYDSLTARLRETHSATIEHGMRMSSLARSLALSLGLSARRAEEIAWAAILHDVGKAEISCELLDKPGPLDPAEYEVVKRHAALGADMLAAAELRQISDWVRHHHERVDGAGYPQGLRGPQIPLESRILAVVDAYDAMAAGGDNVRPYRARMSDEEAFAELRKCAGTQFDPLVVEAFIDLFGVKRDRPC